VIYIYIFNLYLKSLIILLKVTIFFLIFIKKFSNVIKGNKITRVDIIRYFKLNILQSNYEVFKKKIFYLCM
jgi:hypothetical protein